MPAGAARAEQAVRTRDALLVAARTLFARQGFHATATEEIVAHAQVTRGALYHHFGSKEELFLAVFHLVERDFMARAEERGAAVGGWERLVGVARDLLAAAAADVEVQRIVLIDGPAVLGWTHWRELEAGYGLGFITAALEQAIVDGDLPAQEVGPLAHLLLAALDEAALMLAAAEDPAADHDRIWEPVQRLLEGLRA